MTPALLNGVLSVYLVVAQGMGLLGRYYGQLAAFALFLVGWGCSLVWGPVADRFGRVRTLMLTIACYSLFTFLGAVATSVGQLAAFRLLAGVGIGGEWSMGGTFVAEEWPEERRQMAAGAMHTGYYVGFFLAAIANYTIGARWGWRAMFALGGTPALLVAFIRYGVAESKRWQSRRVDQGRPWTMGRAFLALFSPRLRRRTVLNCVYILVSCKNGSITRSLATTAPIAAYEEDSPFAISIRSGRMSYSSEPNHAPKRPKPVITSSAQRRMS